ncbi:phytoene/squalene synthase family protein [Rhodoplanes sp. TEM]|uniref:Phytoene/squalene synthase family protein n=1 Tax=Rhodoplanes tepidamans TaxID=200616 RepID=A0ABT5JK61_RHOTP|nr:MULTISPECIES: phytoene/squalene synthase family protein [Rhodoplanes]MDC7789738.1 phytoene/squalene synthase family protein [Rhodoplanes tepidamans]MDC7987608.1 phytoene/squalene synthase family protein [Rhodoplanes sp. TEM]MDQ0358879.1 phytoene synthase [Rhodoplanes tepidamans]
MEFHRHCEALVREQDRDRFLAALFAPAAQRPHLFALYAFNAEIARVRDAAKTPMAGEIRLQWWRDALAGEGHGDVRANPVAAALLDTVAARALPVEPLLDLLEARSFDLYDDPMAGLDALYGYVRKTSSAVIGLAAHVLAGPDPMVAALAGPAGLGWGLSRILQALPAHASRGQVYVPADLLRDQGVDPADLPARRAGPGLAAVLADLRGRARLELAEAERATALVPAAARPAFLPAALARPLLDRLDRAQAADPFAVVELAPWRRQWVLWRAARRMG